MAFGIQNQPCCSKLNQITHQEVVSLVTNSYSTCLKEQEQWSNQCSSWNRWFRWICIAWSWIRVVVCLVWTTVTNVYWVITAYSSILLCKFGGIGFAVNVLNDILKKNLKNSILLGFGNNVPPNPSLKIGWGLPVFEDNFQGTALDLNKWRMSPEWASSYPNYTPFHPGNITKSGIAPTGYYDNSAIVVNNGLKLKINKAPQVFPTFVDFDGTVYDNNGNGWKIDYKIGHIETINPYKQKYGYFEIRCKMGNSKGVWPAFWLAEGVTWPPEIDIFEMFPTKSFNQFESNYHWGIVDTSDSKAHDINSTSNAFHIYACEWDNCFLKWYYDNMLVRVAYDNVISVNQDFATIVSTGVDDQNGNYREDIDENNNVFEVEYVRTYKK